MGAHLRDYYCREVLGIEIDFSLLSKRVISALQQIIELPIDASAGEVEKVSSDLSIKSWSEIKSSYEGGCILLGNGSSMAVHDKLSYTSLFDCANKNSLLIEGVPDLFKKFDTRDFELILRLLWQANFVNTKLDKKSKAIDDAYSNVRNALIESVNMVHPEYGSISDKFHAIGEFLSKFRVVLSLNYDLIIYWSIMDYNNKNRNSHKGFVDCFKSGAFDYNWLSYKSYYERNTSIVFYPHGNLALCRNIHGGEVKIKSRSNDPLLDIIVEKWRSGNYSPLFVSESDKESKINSITSSAYLSTVYREVISSLGDSVGSDSIVIFGWGFGDQDVHILERLSCSKINKMAISVYKDNVHDRDRIIGLIKRVFNGRAIRVDFYNSTSEGVWVNGD